MSADSTSTAKPYGSPWVAGLGLGLSLLLSFVLVGRGLGASGGFTRVDAALVQTVAPKHARTASYWKRYTTASRGTFDDFVVYELLGVIVGAMVSGFSARRLRREVSKGPRISSRSRLGLALGGGMLSGFGTRVAGGCTSGLGLTGGATLALAGWIFLVCFFGAGFAGAALVRRQWR